MWGRAVYVAAHLTYDFVDCDCVSPLLALLSAVCCFTLEYFFFSSLLFFAWICLCGFFINLHVYGGFPFQTHCFCRSWISQLIILTHKFTSHVVEFWEVCVIPASLVWSGHCLAGKGDVTYLRAPHQIWPYHAHTVVIKQIREFLNVKVLINNT